MLMTIIDAIEDGDIELQDEILVISEIITVFGADEDSTDDSEEVPFI
jgi:hypothetical protein